MVRAGTLGEVKWEILVHKDLHIVYNVMQNTHLVQHMQLKHVIVARIDVSLPRHL